MGRIYYGVVRQLSTEVKVEFSRWQQMGVTVSHVGQHLSNGLYGISHHFTVGRSFTGRYVSPMVLMGEDL